MKKYFYLTSLGGLLLASCNKGVNSIDDQQSGSLNKGGPLVKRDESQQEPLDMYWPYVGDCVNQRENCAPHDVVIYGPQEESWLSKFLRWFTAPVNDEYAPANGEYVAGPVGVIWSSSVPSEPIFRTHEYDNLLVTNFNNLGINTQAQLDRLDNETFYKVLFPDLSDTQRAMLYSHNHSTIIGRNKENGKNFIFITSKDKTTLKDAYANLVFVIPFIFRQR